MTLSNKENRKRNPQKRTVPINPQRMIKKLLILIVAGTLSYGCSSENDDPDPLEEVQYEVLAFEFIPDTGNNTNRLSYEIRFTNPNNVPITGTYQVEVTLGALIQIQAFREDATCSFIDANSNCTFTYEQEISLDNGFIPSREIVSVSYFPDLD